MILERWDDAEKQVWKNKASAISGPATPGKKTSNVSGWNMYMKNQMKVVKDLSKIWVAWKALPQSSKDEWKAKSVALNEETNAPVPVSTPLVKSGYQACKDTFPRWKL